MCVCLKLCVLSTICTRDSTVAEFKELALFSISNHLWIHAQKNNFLHGNFILQASNLVLNKSEAQAEPPEPFRPLNLCTY